MGQPRMRLQRGVRSTLLQTSEAYCLKKLMFGPESLPKCNEIKCCTLFQSAGNLCYAFDTSSTLSCVCQFPVFNYESEGIISHPTIREYDLNRGYILPTK